MAVAIDDRRVRVALAAVRACERELALLVDALDPDDVALANATDVWQAFDSHRTFRVEREDFAGTASRAGGSMEAFRVRARPPSTSRS